MLFGNSTNYIVNIKYGENAYDLVVYHRTCHHGSSKAALQRQIRKKMANNVYGDQILEQSGLFM